MQHGNPHVFRYTEKTVHQALIQKLARMVSSLHAARLLCDRGLFQEQGAIRRMVDEFHEDIFFLAFGVISVRWSGNIDTLVSMLPDPLIQVSR